MSNHTFFLMAEKVVYEYRGKRERDLFKVIALQLALPYVRNIFSRVKKTLNNRISFGESLYQFEFVWSQIFISREMEGL